MSWAKHWAILHHFWKQPFGREGTDQCDKLWLWKRHPMLHKAMQMQGFRSGEICYQYVNAYGFPYFVMFVSLIITFTWGIPTFTVLWEKCIVSTLVFHSRSTGLFFIISENSPLGEKELISVINCDCESGITCSTKQCRCKAFAQEKYVNSM